MAVFVVVVVVIRKCKIGSRRGRTDGVGVWAVWGLYTDCSED